MVLLRGSGDAGAHASGGPAASGGFVLSPSDVATAGACEFGWLRGIDIRLGRAVAIDTADPFLDRLARLGDAHEARELNRLAATRDVVVIPRPSPYTEQTLADAADETRRQLADRREVIAQAAFFDGEFGGFADFLILTDDGAYEVWDAKLARHAKVTALLQVAAYADQLDRLGVPRADDGFLLLGDRTHHRQRLAPVIPVYRHRRAQLRQLLSDHLAQPSAVAWNDPRYSSCGSCPHCAAEVAAADDLRRVAGISGRQRDQLRANGVTTVAQLAATASTVPDLPERTWRRLHAQAVLQCAPREQGAPPAYEVYDTTPIEQLPPADAGDIFFDFEGDPLWTDADGVANGLEYLFGVVDLDQPEGRFLPFWAHDRAEERRALIDFLDYVRQRLARHPGLHIYHYAAYEQSALKRLTVRHSVGEDFLDELLRRGVFVDLYGTVTQSIRVGQPSYSIKKLEPLYMGDQLRNNDGVTTAADSVLQYHSYQAAVADANEVEAARILADIGDYNRYDCVSTWRLRDWLLTHVRRQGSSADGVPASEVPVSSSGATLGGVDAEPASSRLAELQAQADLLLADIPLERARRTAEQQGVALLAAALGYFRREAKPQWWAYFDRCVSPVDEWQEPRGTLIADTVTVTDDWSKPPRARLHRRTLRLTGTLDVGSSLVPGAEVRGVYDRVPADLPLPAGGVRAIGGAATVIAVSTNARGISTVTIEEKTPSGTAPFAEVPLAIFAHSFISAAALEQAIDEIAAEVLAEASTSGCPARLADNAVGDVLARRAPRLRDGSPFDGAAAGSLITPEAVIATLRSLDDSYLAVQGPPGTGKTYVGSWAVAGLVQRGWSVGVVAQSHEVVDNFLQKLVDIGVPAARIGKKPGPRTAEPPWRRLTDTSTVSSFLAENDGKGFVLGGTAWTFAHPDVQGLDLLVIEEAGQFSLAHTIASSQAARNLLLLGDPQQLPQVSQGTHPEPVEQSALGWLSAEHDTLPPTLGYFLARSRRMHSALTRPVSELSYDGRLRSVVEVTDTRRLEGVTPGLHPVPVAHSGNSVASPEEAEATVGLIRGLVGREWTPEASEPPRRLTPADIIVVAPYNAQVSQLRMALDDAGFTDTRVGTVDKFQGQEAPISIVSLAASDLSEVSRGLDFLLDEHRLNVAISRGQWVAYLVYSPTLADAQPTSIHELEKVGAFLRLIERTQ